MRIIDYLNWALVVKYRVKHIVSALSRKVSSDHPSLYVILLLLNIARNIELMNFDISYNKTLGYI